MPDRALYVVDIKDSPHAPHQSTRDKKYYARVAGKSQPISHRMVVDIMGRRQHPNIELEFFIERRFIKGQPRQMGDFVSYALASVSPPPEKDTNTYKLIIRARNTGKVYAQYVNAFIHVPIQLLSNQEVKVWKANRVEKIDGKEYLRYYKDNTVKDSVGGSGLGPMQEVGPARYDPILPGLSHGWEIHLQQDSKNLKREDLFVKWIAYTDNASPSSSEIKVSDIHIADAFEPNLDAIDEDDE